MPAVPSSQHDPAEDVRAPRPGGLLAGAAAVPLGAAVLLAAGGLPWGSRAVLGLAVVVLGAAVLRTRGTVLGARLGPGLPAGLGVVLVVAGAALAAVAGAVGVAGTTSTGTVTGWGAVLLWAVLAATGLVLLGLPAAGRVTTRVAEGTIGVAAGLALGALCGPGALGLSGGASTAVLLLVAALATGAAATARTAAGGPRIAALLAATVLASLTGEATGLIATTTDGLLPGPANPVDGAVQAVALSAGLLLGAVLLGLAFLRRDPLGGVLAAGLLLVSARGNGAGDLTVPFLLSVAGVILTAVLVRSPAARNALGRVLRRTGPERSGAGAGVEPVRSTGALAGALAVLAVQAVGLGDGGADPGWVGPAVAVLAVAGALAIAWLRTDSAGTVAAIAGLAAVFVAQPLSLLVLGARPTLAVEHPGWFAVVGVVQAVVAAAVVVRRRHPMVLALAAVVVVGALSNAIVATVSFDGGGPDPAVLLLALLGVSTVALVVVGTLAIVGPAGWLRALQGTALGLAYAVVVGSRSLSAFDGVVHDTPGGILEGAGRVVAVLLALLLPLGLALVAASTARRPSAAATTGVVLGTAVAAVLAGAVAAWTHAGAPGGPIALTDPLLGFDAAGSGLRGGGAAWPVMLGVLGAALLAAAWWLESRRPVPADAPLAR